MSRKGIELHRLHPLNHPKRNINIRFVKYQAENIHLQHKFQICHRKGMDMYTIAPLR